MFGREKGTGRAVAELPPSPDAAPENGERESVIAPTLKVKGDLDFEGAVRIEGEVQGKVTGQGRLTVDQTGKILGDVMAAEVVIQGIVQGNVTAAARLEVAATAQIAGDVKAPELVVARGAKILGRLDIDSESMTLDSKGHGHGRAPAAVGAEALDNVL